MQNFFGMKEPSAADYLYFDENNFLHLLMPLVGGDSISTDNTCKSALELKTFFYGANHRPSALEILQNYQRALIEDINTLKRIGAVQSWIDEKKYRLTQIKHYILLLQTVKKSFIRPNDPFPSYPPAIHRLFSRSNNCFVIQLCPEKPDFVLRGTSPSFSLTRPQLHRDEHGFPIEMQSDNFSGLGPSLRQKISHALKNSNDQNPYKKLLIDAIVKYYQKKPKPSLLKLQTYCEQFIAQKYQQTIDFKKDQYNQIINEDYFTEFLDESYNEMPVAQATDILFNAAIEDSFWKRCMSHRKIIVDTSLDKNQQIEKITMQIQFFLASVNIYCKAQGLTEQNFGHILDENCEKIAQDIAQCIIQGDSVENELFKIIQKYGLCKLNKKQQQAIIEEFQLNYETIQDSEHFDEFFIFRHEMPGDFFNHHHRISIAFLDLIHLSTPNEKLKKLITPFHGHLQSLKKNQRRKLPFHNVIQNYEFSDYLLSSNPSNGLQRSRFLNANAYQFDSKRLLKILQHPQYPEIINGHPQGIPLLLKKLYTKTQGNILLSLNDEQSWKGASLFLKNEIGAYQNTLFYRFKSPNKQNQVQKLNQIASQFENLPQEIEMRGKILIEQFLQLKLLRQMILEKQSNKQSTLANIIQKMEKKIIELFDLSGTPLEQEDPIRALLNHENQKLGTLQKFTFLHHLDTQWWSDKGLEVLQRLPLHDLHQDEILLLNQRQPEQFDDEVLKALSIDKRFNGLDIPKLKKRGQLFIEIGEWQLTSPVIKWLDSNTKKYICPKTTITAPNIKNQKIFEPILKYKAGFFNSDNRKAKIYILHHAIDKADKEFEQKNFETAEQTLLQTKKLLTILFPEDIKWSWLRFKYLYPKSIEVLDRSINNLQKNSTCQSNKKIYR